MRRSLWPLGLWLLAGAGCVAEPGLVRHELAIPGPWDPSAETRAVAATQWVDVVDSPSIAPDGYCTSTNAFDCSCVHPACTPALPGTRELDAFLRARFPYLRSGGLYCCRQNSARGATTLSVHAIGRAIDLMVPMVGGDADNTRGDAVADYLVANAEHFGVQRVVWDRAFWNGERGFGLLSTASLPHTDHLHVEMSVDGAARRAPFFTVGPPPEGCEPRCDGATLVGADCARTDCASSGPGATCLPAPARCGLPEPAAAMRNASAALPSVSPVASLARFTFAPPRRLFDTRSVAESAELARSDGASSGPLGPSRSGLYTGLGIAGASSAWLNLAVVPSAPTFVSVHDAAGPPPSTSNLNAAPPRVRSNGAISTALGGLRFTSLGDAHVIADLVGTFGPAGAGLRPAGPLRVLDSRAAADRLPAGVPVALDVRAPPDAIGVVGTLTALGSDANGFLSAFDCAAGAPPTSLVNFTAERVSAIGFAAPLSGAQLCVQATQPVHLILDVTGYLVADGELALQALAPIRLLDTRSADALWVGRLGEGQTIELPIQTLPGMPAGVAAAVVNVTSVTASGPGFVTLFPCGAPVPATSSLNHDLDGPVGALSVVGLGAGQLCAYARTRTDLLVDLFGVWVPTPGAPSMPGPGPDPNLDDPDDPGLDGGVLDPDGGAPDPDAAASDASWPGRDGGADAGEPARGLVGRCGCRASGRGTPSWLVLLGSLAAALLGRARRRR